MSGYYDDFGMSRGNGYDHDAGMSVNALNAYDRGIKPLSKITLEDLRLAGWTESKSLAKYLAKSGFWDSCEWHHSGGRWFNKVDFFDPIQLVEEWKELNDDEREAHRLNSKPTEEVIEDRKVKGRYTIWGGSRRRPKKLGDQEFTGVLRNGWIIMDGSSRKKKALGHHISWSFTDEDS